MLDESLIQIKFPTLQKQRGTMQHVAIKGSKLRAKRPDNVARKMSDKFVAGPFDLGVKTTLHFLCKLSSVSTCRPKKRNLHVNEKLIP